MTSGQSSLRRRNLPLPPAIPTGGYQPLGGLEGSEGVVRPVFGKGEE
ncbi:MAG: hypothetical protein ACRBM6_15635 [Geminicoccales bacterium]